MNWTALLPSLNICAALALKPLLVLLLLKTEMWTYYETLDKCTQPDDWH